ncbi:Protein of unknown function [Flavobacterium indicum GPTSA100-9 = DSM 17447]|uniref:DUF2141 domain-containing protein n=1 Tax=Flavobacterium indicum (strain DSM 17447 / CIP 109464 / GPTSA100-9) TaxID=1094466 RepID=H8XNX8_FLAIG|nr:DUF2141 domain-containing protein [Flavobacterium indicum]CCG52245.1 Protein of unknown function [Flavobacterium indicum GPTSA100-9 = DSM 17447]
MFKVFLIMFLFLMNTIVGQNKKLTIEVTGFENNKGQVVVGLCNSEKTFLKVFVYGKTQKIENKKAIIVFDNIPVGEYAVCIFHDENLNNKLDSNFFKIPTEDFGFSNNVRGYFGPPEYKEAKFMLHSNKNISIKVN